MSTKLVQCPYCAEEINADAKKCRHCGEWLTADTRRAHSMTGGSADARAVAKGMKSYGLHRALWGLGMLVSLFLGIGLGIAFQSWTVGTLIYLGGTVLATVRYFRE